MKGVEETRKSCRSKSTSMGGTVRYGKQRGMGIKIKSP